MLCAEMTTNYNEVTKENWECKFCELPVCLKTQSHFAHERSSKPRIIGGGGRKKMVSSVMCWTYKYSVLMINLTHYVVCYLQKLKDSMDLMGLLISGPV